MTTQIFFQVYISHIAIIQHKLSKSKNQPVIVGFVLHLFGYHKLESC